MMFKALAGFAAVLAAVQVAAAPVADTCFTIAEMKALAGLVTGPALTGVATRCAAFPDAAPALSAARASLPGRFKAQAQAAGPVVGGKLEQAMGMGTATEQSADVFTPVVALVMTQMSAKLAKKDCQLVDDIVGTLLPLDDDRLVAIVGGMLIAVGRSSKSDLLRICEVPA